MKVSFDGELLALLELSDGFFSKLESDAAKCFDDSPDSYKNAIRNGCDFAEYIVNPRHMDTELMKRCMQNALIVVLGSRIEGSVSLVGLVDSSERFEYRLRWVPLEMGRVVPEGA